MNAYGLVILATLLGEYLLTLVAELLNLNTLDTPLPDEFKGVYDEEAYRKSQEYIRTRTKFGFVTSTFSLVVTLGFWFAGGFDYVDVIARNWRFDEVWTGVAYIGMLTLMRSLISLPFSVYSTFVIEDRFGFNRTTLKTFGMDIVKGLLLAVMLGGPLLVGILTLFQYAGNMAWLYCWIVATLFILIVQFIAPAWIMPLFNKFTPLDEGELKSAIMSYATSVRFSLKDVFVMDGSKRSTKSNAFFTGFGKNKRIALFDTLLQKHTVPELVSVLAHEIGHYKKKHIVQQMVITIAHIGVMLFLLSFFLENRGLFDAFYMKHMSVYGGMIFFGMLFSPIEFILSIVLHVVSRRNEFEADRYSADTYGQPQAMTDALKKLSVHNLSHLTPHPMHVFLNYSHPPVLERIRALGEEHRAKSIEQTAKSGE